MADEALLQILRQGTEVWNEWRERHAEIIVPDLSGADLTNEELHLANLSDANFSGAILRRTILSDADLSGAVLSGADLSGADLSDANLNNANVSGANLRHANLSGADLSSADFSGARLYGADLSVTNLHNANLSNANLYFMNLTAARLFRTNFKGASTYGTVFSAVDLRGAEGLETVMHFSLSQISISTIYKSGGKIPEIFLRGCGVPEPFIIQIPALVAAMQPIQFYSCFISYSSKDQKFAERLYADLQNKGVRCWYAPHDLKIGERIRVGIDESIRVHDKLLLILSKNSIESEWVEKEVEAAMERERQQKRTILFPIRLDDTVLKVESGWAADVRRSRNVGDFRRWKSHDTYSKAFEKLLGDLKAGA
jgi:hypothetical protein